MASKEPEINETNEAEENVEAYDNDDGGESDGADDENGDGGMEIDEEENDLANREASEHGKRRQSQSTDSEYAGEMANNLQSKKIPKGYAMVPDAITGEIDDKAKKEKNQVLIGKRERKPINYKSLMSSSNNGGSDSEGKAPKKLAKSPKLSGGIGMGLGGNVLGQKKIMRKPGDPAGLEQHLPSIGDVYTSYTSSGIYGGLEGGVTLTMLQKKREVILQDIHRLNTNLARINALEVQLASNPHLTSLPYAEIPQELNFDTMESGALSLARKRPRSAPGHPIRKNKPVRPVIPRKKPDLPIAAPGAPADSLDDLDDIEDETFQIAPVAKRSKRTPVPTAKPPKPNAPKPSSGGGGSVSKERLGLSKCKRLISDLMKHKFAWPFNQPVDPVALNLPDYYNVIKTPMDFSTIKHKLDNEQYQNIDQVANDFATVIKNARLYNGPEHDVTKMGDALEEWFNPRFSTLKNKTEEDHVKAIQRRSQLAHPPSQEYMGLQATVESLQQEIRKMQQSAPTTEPPKPMDLNEKTKLSQEISSLSEDQLATVVQIIQDHNQNSLDEEGNPYEIVIDIDTLDAATLRALERYVNEIKENKNKKVIPPPPKTRAPQRKSNSAPKHAKSKPTVQTPPPVNPTQTTANVPSSVNKPAEPPKRALDSVIVENNQLDNDSSDESDDGDSDTDDERKKRKTATKPTDKPKNHLDFDLDPLEVNNAVNGNETSESGPKIIPAATTLRDDQEIKLQNVDSWTTLDPSENSNANLTAPTSVKSATPTESTENEASLEPLWSSFQQKGKQMQQREKEKQEWEQQLKKEQLVKEAERRKEEEKLKKEAEDAEARAKREAEEMENKARAEREAKREAARLARQQQAKSENQEELESGFLLSNFETDGFASF